MRLHLLFKKENAGRNRIDVGNSVETTWNVGGHCPRIIPGLVPFILLLRMPDGEGSYALAQIFISHSSSFTLGNRTL